MMCAEPGTMPTRKPSTVPRAIGIADSRHSLRVGSSSRKRGAVTLAVTVRLGVERISPRPNSPTATGTMPMPSPRSGNVEGVAEMAGHHVDADAAEQQAEGRHQQRAGERGGRHVGEEDQAEDQERGVFRRPEAQRKGAERRRDHGQRDDAEGAGDERADRGDAERRAGAALLRHGVAVDAGHHRGGLARNPHQDRGGRAAVLRAVIDAGQHDDRLGGVEAEGHRQQDADAGERTDAGQHADQRADHAAEERVRAARPAGTRPRSRAAGCRWSLPRGLDTRTAWAAAATSAAC